MCNTVDQRLAISGRRKNYQLNAQTDWYNTAVEWMFYTGTIKTSEVHIEIETQFSSNFYGI